VLLCEAGRKQEARVEFERLAADDFVGLPRNHLYLYHLAVLAIVGHSLGDRRRAAGLYELLLPFADHNVLPARLPLGTLGSASQHLGLLAATMSRWDEALSHFQAAVQAHERMQALPLLARSRHHYGRALLARGRPDDRRRAQEHLDWRTRSPTGWGCAGWPARQRQARALDPVKSSLVRIGMLWQCK
jgi:hypothetical protein